MKPNALLIVTSLLSILLLSIHVALDVVRGADKWGPQSLIGVLILVVLLYGTLVLGDRRSGLVIMLFAGLFAAAMPVIHWRVSLTKPNTFLFLWTLFALGAIGTVTILLAVQGLRKQSSVAADQGS